MTASTRATLWPERLQRRGLQRNSPLAHLFVKGMIDILSWVAALVVADLIVGSALVVTDLVVETQPMSWETIGLTALAVVVIQLIIGSALAVYRNRFPFGGTSEMRVILLAVMLVAALAVIVAIGTAEFAWLLAWPTIVIAAAVAAVLMLLLRHGLRVALDAARKPNDGARVVIIGAGEAGSSLIRQMHRDNNSAYLPVALVDDDVAKRDVRIEGVTVKGTTDRLAEVARAVNAAGVVVAIGAADSVLLRSFQAQLRGTGVWIHTVPPISELINGQVPIAAIRDLNVEDLIGRQPVEIDLDRIRAHVAGRRVLVTGAGGSIGSELCRQLNRLDPGELMMLDRDESALHSLKMSITGSALMTSRDLILADIRDADALRQIFRERQPQVVFHAAALKHLPMLEQYPQEGWKTNVHGTLNVLEAAREVGVAHFVNISTDKAANPTSNLGRTKRVAERLTASAASLTGESYLSVRFGNVLGSRGSVLISFKEQIEAGGPLTVTHPDVTRYFMTIPEACQLVLQAAVDGRSGETLVLDMGAPVKIVDLATRLMDLSGRSCEIVYTGLREGEKLDEELFTEIEENGLRSHEKISHVRVTGLPASTLPTPTAPLSELDAFLDVEAAGPARLTAGLTTPRKEALR